MVITELIKIAIFKENRTQILDKKSRGWHGLILYTGEASQMTVRGQTFRNVYGDLLFLPRNLAYQQKQLEGITEGIVVDFFAEAVGDWFFIRNCEDMLTQFNECVQLWRNRENEDVRLDLMSRVYAIFAEAFRRRGTDAVCESIISRRRIAPSLEYINENFTDPSLRIGTLAELSGMSTRHLSRLFCEAVGMSPKAYIEDLRFKYADDLLDHGYSITEIARLAGYADLYHFSKVYKAKRGVTPSGRTVRSTEKTESDKAIAGKVKIEEYERRIRE